MTDWLKNLLSEQPQTAKALPGLQITEPLEGVIDFKPASFKQRIIISAGIHGNETAPIELLSELVEAILAKTLPVARHVICLIGNPAAVRKGVRFVDINMNRMFSKAYEQYPGNGEAKRAEQISRFLASRCTEAIPTVHFDLHTAIRPSKFEKFAVSPFGQRITEKQQWRLKSCGVEALLHSHQAATTFSFESFSRFGAEAYTVELGKVAPFGKNQLDMNAIKHHLQDCISDTVSPVIERPLQQFQVVHELIRSSEHFTLHISDSTENFESFPLGTLIATDGASEYRTRHANERVVFPNPSVPIGQRAGLLVVNKNSP